MYGKSRAWIELDMEHLRHNVRLFQSLLPAGCRLMPAVKANAYGHGAVFMGKVLQELGIRDFCVASLDEGIELRKNGIAGQILILGYTHPQDFDRLGKYELTQTVVDYAHAKAMENYGKELTVHVSIDTGMHRLGTESRQMEQILDIWNCRNLHITGVFSHLCTSDGVSPAERAFVRRQEQEFQKVLAELHRRGKKDFAAHLQGTYGILYGTDMNYDYARAGIGLYGVFSEPEKELEQRFPLKPVLSLKARIGCVRELCDGEGAGYGLAWRASGRRRLAVAAIGYGDGIPRELSNKGHALVCGKKVPIVGRICMDQLLLDVTKVPDVWAGEEAVFIGKSGEMEIKAEEMAYDAHTISNEILSRLGQRLERVLIFPSPQMSRPAHIPAADKDKTDME